MGDYFRSSSEKTLKRFVVLVSEQMQWHYLVGCLFPNDKTWTGKYRLPWESWDFSYWASTVGWAGVKWVGVGTGGQWSGREQ